MNYAEYLKGSLLGDEQIFQMARKGRARKFVLVNICILGILFGLSDLIGIQETQPLPLEGKFAVITPVLFSISGFFTMLIAVVGCTLVYWSASRAFGGSGGFPLTFDLVGLSVIPFWLLAPLFNYTFRFHPSALSSLSFIVPAVLGTAWAYFLLRRSLIAGQHITPTRASFAVIGVCIFAVSAIYVFIP